jgi:hypothetical protein
MAIVGLTGLELMICSRLEPENHAVGNGHAAKQVHSAITTKRTPEA